MKTTLPTRPLGKTGFDLTRVGFGSWAAGGEWQFGWGHQDDADSIAAIRHALELGINWIDTASAYGLGHSEEIVAKALAGLSDSERPLVFTKAGIVWDRDDRSRPVRRSGAPDSLRRELEASLRRLAVEQIDLYQMHWPPDDGTPIEVYWEFFLQLKAEGKIAAAGLSNHPVELLERAERVGHVDSLQPPYSLIKRAAGADVIPWCQVHDTGVIVYSPMQAGLLSGTFTKERAAALGEGDWRTANPDFSGAKLKANLALADALAPVAARHQVTPGAVAIAWTMANPGVTAAIVGARSPNQVDGWASAATLELSDADLDELANALQATGAGAGPVR